MHKEYIKHGMDCEEMAITFESRVTLESGECDVLQGLS